MHLHHFIYTFIAAGLLLSSCLNRTNKEAPVEIVDFSINDSANINGKPHDSTRTLNVAVAAIISPRESFIYYKELMDYISNKLNIKTKIKQRKTYQEINQMLRNNEVELAFICSGAYVKEKEISGIEILVVPVCSGAPFYNALVITNKNSQITKFEDLRQKSFAYTDPLSLSGRMYVSDKLSKLGQTDESYFSNTMYSHAHDISIQLVSKRVVDGATVDGLIYTYLEQYHPERVKNIRIIEKSQDFGIPPVVVPAGIDPDLKYKLKNIFLSLHNDPKGQDILNKLLIDSFMVGDDANYQSIRMLQH